MTALRALLAALALLLALAPGARAEELLRNTGLDWWEGPLPQDWTPSVGAQQGEGPASRIEPGAEGGVRLAGDASTRVWRMLSQKVAVEPGATYVLRFEARLRDARLDAGQRRNAWVGIRQGALDVRGVREDVWTPDLHAFRAAGTEVEVGMFLSHTGALEVRRLSLERVPPDRSGDLLLEAMDRHYPFFAIRGVDWPSHAKAHLPAIRAAADEPALVKALHALLDPLGDTHVWLRRPGGAIDPTVTTPPIPNFDFRAVAKSLRGVRQVARVGFTGETEDGLGYVAVATLHGPDADFAALEEAVRALLGKPGLVVDLRANGGGNEVHALSIASLLTDEPRAYARRRFRAGPGHADFTKPEESWVVPDEGSPFRKPVVVLLGPACVSSGEGFAQMLDVLPHARSVGLPTRGASGNPAPVPLAHGVDVWFSRWTNEQMDGTALEGRGVQPDVLVPWRVGEGEAGRDPVFEKGLEVLRGMVAR